VFNLASFTRPYFGAVLLSAVLLTAGGIWSALHMPSGVYPEVSFPRIGIVARKPGLDVASMEAQVTLPLEEAATGVLGVAQVRSKTIRGASELSVDFTPGTDMQRAEHLTWNRLGTARLPADVKPTVERMTPSIFPILSLVLTGGDNGVKLHDYAVFDLAPKIKTIPDVLYANVAGGDIREITVEARPTELLAAGLSAADLADLIGRAHRLQPVGRIEQQPLAFQVIVNTQAETARQIGDLVLATRHGQPLRVRDVADVRVGRQDRVLSIGYAGKDAVVVTVFRSPGGNTVAISRAVRELLAGVHMPGNVKANIVYDQAVFIQTAVDNVRDAILIGGLFSVLILLAFLRDWRATLISALAIPTTLAITFLFLRWAGETLNLMSLGGLAVAIGLIIDDTVVVIENIARHLGPASKEVDPIGAASREITGAVVGSTLTTVLVFVPLAFITGVYGQFFASLSWALSIAVLVSMVVSLTLIPVFAARFLAGKPMRQPGRLYEFFASIYDKFLAGALRFPLLTLVASVAAAGLGVVLYTGIPNPLAKKEVGHEPAPLVSSLKTGLMPAMDEGAFVVDYWAPSGTPLEETEKRARTIEEVLAENPDVDGFVRRTGAELGLFATQTNRGDVQVVLRPAEDDLKSLLTKPVRPSLKELEAAGFNLEKDRDAIRKKYRRRPVTAVMDEVKDEIGDHYVEHQLKVETVQIMKDELNDLSGANKPVEVKLFGPSYHELREQAEVVGKALKKIKEANKLIEDINDNVLLGNPDLAVVVDGGKAARMGLTADTVERQLAAIHIGQVATQVRESALRLTDVRVRYPDSYRFGAGRFDPSRILNQWLLLPEATPAAIRWAPVSAVATVSRTRTPEEQLRENQRPVHIITAELDEKEGGDLGTVVTDIRREMASLQLPAGYSWDIGGHYVQQQAAFRSFALVMAVAVFLVYVMLAFQFRSAVLPMLIFLTQPLSLVSGLFALWLMGTPLNVSSYMGAILLIGLDMKNGILLVERIQQLRRDGTALRPALLQAGRARFRPILMTSLAAILGLLPLALGIGPGAQMQQPLAIMVIGGLTANMLFTRLVIPAGYLLMEPRAVADEGSSR
jgi:multidrug efflux pump subunit AcrB